MAKATRLGGASNRLAPAPASSAVEPDESASPAPAVEAPAPEPEAASVPDPAPSVGDHAPSVADGDDDHPFDPSLHTVGEVLDYLADSSDEEHERVVDAERAGKGRVSITGGG